MRSVELFAGAGGLGLATELAGFKPAMTVEWNRWACDTLRENQRAGFPLVKGWNIVESDVRAVDWTGIGDVALVSGGPPCQPFSLGGHGRSFSDSRDMFPAMIGVLRELRPAAFLIENVRGLTRRRFDAYFEYIRLQLTYPDVSMRAQEDWPDHLGRLRSLPGRRRQPEFRYRIALKTMNAADYGVAQQRHRVFLVGLRSDIEATFQFPEPTHSNLALLHDQFVSGVYWDRPGVRSARPKQGHDNNSQQLARLRSIERAALGAAWVTVREALAGLPDPRAVAPRVSNHVFQPGARSYVGHTGSVLDWPAKTLKAGAHGVPGGENMIRFPDGTLRYFTVREAARLQGFADDFELHGAWSEAMRQIGNAVPVPLGAAVARSLFDVLQTHSRAAGPG